MKEEHKLITIILKSGLITWLLLLAVWSFGAMFYTDDFLPGPFVTLKGMAGLISDGTLEKDIMFSLIRVLKGWILGRYLRDSVWGILNRQAMYWSRF